MVWLFGGGLVVIEANVYSVISFFYFLFLGVFFIFGFGVDFILRILGWFYLVSKVVGFASRMKGFVEIGYFFYCLGGLLGVGGVEGVNIRMLG